MTSTISSEVLRGFPSPVWQTSGKHFDDVTIRSFPIIQLSTYQALLCAHRSYSNPQTDAKRGSSFSLSVTLFQVDILKRNTETGPSVEEEEFMDLACCVMDATAFETAQIPKEVISKKPTLSTEEERPLNGLTPSVRGLYPLAAMMNHECVPNTRHGYDERQRMTVRAAVDIPAGVEVTTTYTSLLWGSPARRHHLAITKHFLCSCPRCVDPQVPTQTFHHSNIARSRRKTSVSPSLSVRLSVCCV